MKRAKTKSKNDLVPGTLEMLILKTLSIESMHGDVQQDSQVEDAWRPFAWNLLTISTAIGLWRQHWKEQSSII